MRSVFLLLTAFFIFVISSLAEEPQPTPSWVPVTFQVAPQPDCPMQITIDRPYDRGPGVRLRVYNGGTKAVRAFVMVVKSDPRDYTWTYLPAPRPFGAGETHMHDVTLIFPGQNKGDKAAVSFDYLEFTDGTIWGADAYHKSKNIADYYKGKEAAIANLRELLRDHDDADFERELSRQPGFASGEPVALTNEESVRKMDYSAKGYEGVTVMLLRMKIRVEEAANLAKKLQSMQKTAYP